MDNSIHAINSSPVQPPYTQHNRADGKKSPMAAIGAIRPQAKILLELSIPALQYFLDFPYIPRISRVRGEAGTHSS